MDTRHGLPRFYTSGKYACVYCGEKEADTDDHTPPRSLLLPPLPSYAKTLPSCQACNQAFSWDEETVKAFVTALSDHPELGRGSARGRDTLEALKRDKRRESLIEASRDAAGRYRITPEISAAFCRVVAKSVRGLYHALYDDLRPLSDFTILSIDDARRTDRESMVDDIRPPRVRDITDQPLPPVSESMRSRVRVVTMDVMPIGGGQPTRIEQVWELVRDQPVDWIEYQTSVFVFGFVERESGGAACVIELWRTLLISVAAPWPGARGHLRRGRKNPFSRGMTHAQ